MLDSTPQKTATIKLDGKDISGFEFLIIQFLEQKLN